MARTRRVTKDAQTARATAPATTTFRFVDLPPEIRNRIYSLAVAKPPTVSLDLAKFTEPNITTVSRQLRHESLPIVFAERTFHVFVGSDLRARHITRRTNSSTRSPAHQYRVREGTLGINPTVKKFIRDCKTAAIFQHVRIYVCGMDWIHDARQPPKFCNRQGARRRGYRMRPPTDHLSCCTLGLDFTGQHLNVDVSEKWAPFDRWVGTQAYEMEDVDAAVSEVVAIVKQLAQREGFKGFNLQDLEAIALEFRFVS